MRTSRLLHGFDECMCVIVLHVQHVCAGIIRVSMYVNACLNLDAHALEARAQASSAEESRSALRWRRVVKSMYICSMYIYRGYIYMYIIHIHICTHAYTLCMHADWHGFSQMCVHM
jgi:hypothetical protein